MAFFWSTFRSQRDFKPLSLGDEPFQFHFAKEFFHRGPSTTAIIFADWL